MSIIMIITGGYIIITRIILVLSIIKTTHNCYNNSQHVVNNVVNV